MIATGILLLLLFEDESWEPGQLGLNQTKGHSRKATNSLRYVATRPSTSSMGREGRSAEAPVVGLLVEDIAKNCSLVLLTMK
jgi:hypothetical protein